MSVTSRRVFAASVPVPVLDLACEDFIHKKFHHNQDSTGAAIKTPKP